MNGDAECDSEGALMAVSYVEHLYVIILFVGKSVWKQYYYVFRFFVFPFKTLTLASV